MKGYGHGIYIIYITYINKYKKDINTLLLLFLFNIIMTSLLFLRLRHQQDLFQEHYFEP